MAAAEVGSAAISWGPVLSFAGSLAGVVVAHYLNRNNKIREQSWEKRQEAYSVIVTGLEDALLNARICAVFERHSNLTADKASESMSVREQFSKVRFLVSHEFSDAYNEMNTKIYEVGYQNLMFAAFADFIQINTAKLARIAEDELRLPRRVVPEVMPSLRAIVEKRPPFLKR